MPSINVGFNDRNELVRYGPTMFIQIGFDPNYQPGQSHPQISDRPHPALVDTGAMECCIDSALAMDLELPVVDRQTVAGVHGPNAVNFHLAQIYIPQLRYTIYGLFAGVHLTAGGQPHSALMGRTFLNAFTLTYEGERGTVTISNDAS